MSEKMGFAHNDTVTRSAIRGYRELEGDFDGACRKIARKRGAHDGLWEIVSDGSVKFPLKIR